MEIAPLLERHSLRAERLAAALDAEQQAARAASGSPKLPGLVAEGAPPLAQPALQLAEAADLVERRSSPS